MPTPIENPRQGIPNYSARDRAAAMLEYYSKPLSFRGGTSVRNDPKKPGYIPGAGFYRAGAVEIAFDPFQKQRGQLDLELSQLDKMTKAGATAGFMRFQLKEWLTRDFDHGSMTDIV